MKPQNIKIDLKINPFTRLLPGQSIDDGIYNLSSTFDSKAREPLRGLTIAEEAILLPILIGTNNTGATYHKDVKDYWKGFSTPIETNGRTLEVGLIYNDSKEIYPFTSLDDLIQHQIKAIVEKGAYPINLEDYILFRFAVKHSQVANDYDDIRKSPNKIRFYLASIDKEIKDKVSKAEKEDKAFELYLEIKKDEQKLEDILILFNVSVKNLSQDEKSLKLKEITKIDIDKFITIVSDKNLQLKAFIYRAVSYGIIDKIPNTEIFNYVESRLGDTLNESVEFMKSTNPKNQLIYEQIYTTLQAKMQEDGIAKKYEINNFTTSSKVDKK